MIRQASAEISKAAAPSQRAEEPGECRAENEPEIRRDRHPAEIRAAVVIRADVGEVGVGDRHVAAGEAVERAGEEQHRERHRERERTEPRRIDAAKWQRRQRDRQEEDCPRGKRAELTQQQDAAPPVAIRPAAEQGRTDELKQRVGRAHQPEDERVAAEPGHQKNQRRHHDAESERANEIDAQDREDRHSPGKPA